MRFFKTVFPVVAAWTLGAVCFAVFLTTLDEPMPPRVVERPSPAVPPLATLTPRTEPSPPLIELDPIVIVAHVGPYGAARGVSEDGWACDAWRPLVQGGVEQRVRLCRTADEAKTGEPLSDR